MEVESTAQTAKVSPAETQPLILRKPNTIFLNDFSEEIWFSTYKYHTDADVNDTQFRVARALAAPEREEIRDYWTMRFCELLENFKLVPGGRISSNAGTGLKGTTLINCFVDGFMGTAQDSMDGIMSTLHRQALILKSEGGYGFCADVMRPKGAFINGIGVEGPGAVKMLEMWDKQSEVITAGSGEKKKTKKGKNKIRKGAMMVTMSDWHPSIEQFITAKLTPGRLTKFNMSALISDEFMHAVENNLPWNLEFPETDHPQYDSEWDGNLRKWKAKGYPTKVWHTYTNANELWDIIMRSTYNRNEPGVLFIDTINRLNNLWYCEHINATNPCGEQVLPIGGVCLLGSLNLTQYVDLSKNDWDYEKLAKDIPVAVRLLDNVNDVTNVPLPSQKENLKNKRRIGLGYLGYASALFMMRVRYGSDEALALTEKLGNFVMNTAYKASADIAREKEPFLLFDKEKYLQGEFTKKLSPEVREYIAEHGMRNSHLLSIQPTGNSSIYANNVSGGLEPIFMPEYIRTSIQAYAPEGMTLPVVDWANKSWHPALNGADKEKVTDWQWAKEGDENLLVTKHNGDVYKFDQSRGLLKETKVKDYSVVLLERAGEWDNKAEWAADASKLTIDDHVRTMGVFAKYVDSAMSKTVNLPADYPYEDFTRLYKEVYKTGQVKGCTTYRTGTMTSVLAAESTAASTEKPKNSIAHNNAPKRPERLPCYVHHVTADGIKWVVLVGMYHADAHKVKQEDLFTTDLTGYDPYECFSLRYDKMRVSPKVDRAVIHKNGKYSLELDDGTVVSDISRFYETGEQNTVSRLISWGLRHGGGIHFAVEQLQKGGGTVVSFSKSIARTLKKYINDPSYAPKCGDCGSKNMEMAEGCYKCKDCGSSKCS